MAKVRFQSRYAEHRLVMKPTRRVLSESGEPFLKYGHSIEFHDSMYETDDPAEIEYLRSHPGFGSEIIEVTAEDLGPATKTRKVEMVEHVPAETVGELPTEEISEGVKADDEEAA